VGELVAARQKVAVVMPAYNAEKTLERTYADIPKEYVDDIILVDDASRDRTVEIARGLGLHVVVHPENRGYGANQKTCYRTALERGADVVIMVHPDHQYDPRVIPDLLETLRRSGCDAVFGSRMLGGRPIQGGMPKWKYLGNILLTAIENATFLIYLTEYHSGFRAYTRRYLESVDFDSNSDGFVFDTEIIAQGMARRLTIREIPIETRYFDEASQIAFGPSVRYGLEILKTMSLYKLHEWGVWSGRVFRGPGRRQLPTAAAVAAQPDGQRAARLPDDRSSPAPNPRKPAERPGAARD
jgi:glycosyltransferase involved in cell wall biosynthesis